MIEHPVDKAYRTMNEVSSAAQHALMVGNSSEYENLKGRLVGMAVTFTPLLLDTLRALGYDARAYAGGWRHVYVKIGSHPIEVWFYGQPHYIVKFRPSDTLYNQLTAFLPTYGRGLHTYSILQVIDALEEIDTTIRTYEQCCVCHYSSVGAMGHGSSWYCGAGVVPVLPQCSQYQHYPMQALVSWV